MLKSYEAIYENGQIFWLHEQPEVFSARLIVTVLEAPFSVGGKRRSFNSPLAGQIKILGDIVGPMIDEGDWECLK